MWLLLTSLLFSGLSPLGDSEGVVGYCSWSLCRKLPLSGQMTPRGPGTLQIQSEHHCMCIQRSCAYAEKLRTSPFYLAYAAPDDHGHSLSHQDVAEIIHRSHILTLVVFPHHTLISRDTSTRAGGEVSHIAMDIIRDRPNSRSAWVLHHHTAASGHDFQAFSLETSKSRPSDTTAQQQKVMTKRYCGVTAVVISCCLKVGEIRAATNIRKISEEQIAGPQIKQKDGTQPAMDIQAPRQYDGQSSKAVVSQRDIVQTATLHSGSSSVETAATSRLETKRSAASFMKKNEHLNSVQGPTLQESRREQLSLKAASSADDYDGDGFYELLLVSREKKDKDKIKRPQYKLRATQDDDKEDFSGKIITKQAKLRRLEARRETQHSHTNTIEYINKKRLTNVAQTDSTNQRDNNNVDDKQMLGEVGEEALITLFLLDTQTELDLNTDTGWKKVNIPKKELVDPPSRAKVIQENFIIKADECMRETLFLLYIYATDRKERIDLKPAESTAKVTAASEEVKETTEETEHAETNNAPHENMSINQTKQDENVPSEETVVPSPPSYKIRGTEPTITTEPTTQTAAVSGEDEQTTSSLEVVNQTSTRSPEPEPGAGPRFTTRNTKNTGSTTRESFSGLRMREDVTKPHEATENKDGGTTNRPEAAREEDPRPAPSAASQPSETIGKQAANSHPQSADDSVPPCRGLIHRTEAGWKHCVERFAGTGSKLIPSVETEGAFKETGEPEKGHPSVHDDDEYDHFYYFDGVLKRVRNNFYPHDKSERRGERRHESSESSAGSVRQRGGENLLTYIRRLTLRNKLSHFTDHNVQRGSDS